jgi:hypothetical protein
VLETAARRQPTGELLIRARALYRADAESLDLSLEALLSRLEQDAGRWDTHVVITADHGESLGEDASVGHGRRLTPAQIHVPLVVLSPVVSSAVREDVAGSIDVAPTLLALAGIRERMPGGRNLLAPAVTSASAFGMRRTFARPHDDRRLDGVHRLDFELFYAAGPDGRLLTGNGDGLRELAPGTSASPEEEQRLRRLFGSFERELQTGTPARTDPEAEEALRALGYVG